MECPTLGPEHYPALFCIRKAQIKPYTRRMSTRSTREIIHAYCAMTHTLSHTPHNLLFMVSSCKCFFLYDKWEYFLHYGYCMHLQRKVTACCCFRVCTCLEKEVDTYIAENSIYILLRYLYTWLIIVIFIFNKSTVL